MSKDQGEVPRTEELTRMMRESIAQSDRDESNNPVSDNEPDELRERLRALTEQLASAKTDLPGDNADIRFATDIESATDKESPAEKESPTDDTTPATAADDYINGTSLADMLTSDEFLDGLDDTTKERIRKCADVRDDAEPEEGRESIPDADIPAAPPADWADEETDDARRESDEPIEPPEADEGEETDPDGVERAGADAGDELPNITPTDMPREVKPQKPKASAPRSPTHFDPMQISLDHELSQRAYYLPPASRPEPAARPTGQTEPESRPAVEAASGKSPVRRGKPTAQEPDTPQVSEAVDPALDDEKMQDRDTEMYIRLGYEDELRRSATDAARVEKVMREVTRRERVGTRNQIPAAYRGQEYMSEKQTPAVDAAYRRATLFALLRTTAAALGMLGGVLLDCLPLIGQRTPALADFVDTPFYPLCGLLVLLLCSLPFINRLGLGLRSLWDFEPVRYAPPACALIVSVLHTLVTCFTVDPGNDSAPTLFGGAALGILLIASVAELIAIRAEQRSFCVVSSGKAHFVITEDHPDEKQAESGRAPEDSPAVVLRAGRTRRLLDFFTWANRYNSRMSRLNILLPIALMLAILCGCVTALNGGSLLTDGLNAFTAVYLAALPASYLFAMALPLLRVNRLLGERGCAVIGEAAPERYVPDRPVGRGASGKAQLRLADGFALSAENVMEITRRGDAHAQSHILMAHKLFALLDCAMINGLERPREDELAAIRAELTESGEQFLRLYMTDTRTHSTVEVMAGSHEALSSRGIRLPGKENESNYRKTDSSQVLYVAFDRRFGFACAAEYRLTGAFAHTVHMLHESDCAVSLISYDPLVTPATLAPSWAKRLPSIGLIRPDRIEALYEQKSSGIVATNQGLTLCGGYVACRRMKSSYRLGALWSWLSLIGGAAVAFLLSVYILPAFLPLLILAMQGVSVGAAIALVVSQVNRQTLDLAKKRSSPARARTGD